MTEEIVDVIEAQEFKVPAVGTGSQAFLLIVAGFSFFFTNYKKMIFSLTSLRHKRSLLKRRLLRLRKLLRLLRPLGH